MERISVDPAIDDLPISGHCYIYALRDPDAKEIRYVGQTKNVRFRYIQHLNGQKHNPALAEWIQGLLAESKRPEIEVLEDLPGMYGWHQRELEWIRRYYKPGISLNLFGVYWTNEPDRKVSTMK